MSEEDKLAKDLREDSDQEAMAEQRDPEAEILEDKRKPGTSKDEDLAVPGPSHVDAAEERCEEAIAEERDPEAEILEEEPRPGTSKDEDLAVPGPSHVDAAEERCEKAIAEERDLEAEILEEEPRPGTSKDEGHAYAAHKGSPFKFPASPEKRRARRKSPLKRAVEAFFSCGPKLPPASDASPTKVAARTARWAQEQSTLVEESDLEPPETPDLLSRLELDTSSDRQVKAFIDRITGNRFENRGEVYEELPDETLHAAGIRTEPPVASSEDLSSTPTSTPGTSRPSTSHAVAPATAERSPRRSPTPPPQRPTRLDLPPQDTEEDRPNRPRRKGERKR
ncbi:hypothetical protein V5799_020904 [Amblyomma americanum]|uniref:Uncharacterized protein n=1 Tax=Amblyomma americanum TaxID=6943 RepID=A0AAQ4ESZ8_AMBAM